MEGESFLYPSLDLNSNLAKSNLDSFSTGLISDLMYLYKLFDIYNTKAPKTPFSSFWCDVDST